MSPLNLPGKKAFSLTFVVYDEGDLVQQLLALITLAPIFCIVAYATLIVARRQLHTVWVLAGQLINEVINYVLKHVIREPRPAGCHLTNYGMPSSHSQFMAYLAVTVLLWSIRRARFQNDVIAKIILNAAFCGLCALVMYSRVALGYHTTEQVAAGAACGVTFGLIWSWLCATFAEPFFAKAQSWPICKFFYLRGERAGPGLCAPRARVRQSPNAALAHRFQGNRQSLGV